MGPEARDVAPPATGRGVRIAIVDSGVHASHPHISGRFAGGLAIDEYGREHPGYVDRLGHGTAVAAAIKEKAPDADLFAVKVFDRALSTSITALVHAIEWAANAHMHIVNLSLGTSRAEHEEVLRGAVDRAHAQGTLVVAAGSDGTVTWLPGSLARVISVRVEWSCPRQQFRIVRFADTQTFLASGFPRGIPGVRASDNLNGLSFAVANMTGFVARAVEVAEDRSFDTIVRGLERAADSVVHM